MDSSSRNRARDSDAHQNTETAGAMPQRAFGEIFDDLQKQMTKLQRENTAYKEELKELFLVKGERDKYHRITEQFPYAGVTLEHRHPDPVESGHAVRVRMPAPHKIARLPLGGHCEYKAMSHLLLECAPALFGNPLPDFVLSDIDVFSIHPIFAKENFIGLNRPDYERCRQGLCLASKFITSPVYMDWWIQAAFGVPVKYKNSDNVILLPPADLEETRYQKQAIVSSALLELAQRIVFRFEHLPPGRYGHADFEPFRPLRPGAAPCSHRLFLKNCASVKLSSDFLLALRRKAPWKITSWLYFYFQFATLLVHELCHCFGFLRLGSAEPLHNHLDPRGEWGWSWEVQNLGGVILMEMPGSPLTICKWESIGPNGEVVTGKEKLPITHSWVEDWFRRYKWEEMEAKGVRVPCPMSNLALRVEGGELVMYQVAIGTPDFTVDDCVARLPKVKEVNEG